jgi:hypothetical protein
MTAGARASLFEITLRYNLPSSLLLVAQDNVDNTLVTERVVVSVVNLGVSLVVSRFLKVIHQPLVVSYIQHSQIW